MIEFETMRIFFHYRFCFDEFQKNFSATIGVDMHVKTIKVKRQWVALQLWDTAGQERYVSFMVEI